jgi:hypothetical protein
MGEKSVRMYGLTLAGEQLPGVGGITELARQTHRPVLPAQHSPLLPCFLAREGPLKPCPL